MLKKIAVVLTAATVLGVAAPASAEIVYGGGWWGGPSRHYSYYPHRYNNYYAYYPRRHFHRKHFYVRRSWWGGY